jgi:hypothetical protein
VLHRLLAWLKTPIRWPSSTFDDLQGLSSIGRMIGGRVTTLEEDARDSANARRRREHSPTPTRQRPPTARWKLIALFAGMYGVMIILVVALIMLFHSAR